MPWKLYSGMENGILRSKQHELQAEQKDPDPCFFFTATLIPVDPGLLFRFSSDPNRPIRITARQMSR